MDENTICRDESIVEQIHDAEIQLNEATAYAEKSSKKQHLQKQKNRYINFSILSEYNDFQKSLRILQIR
jgi:hypothetical protein